MKKRKLNRLRGFDYSSNNGYFVTICTHPRKPVFGEVKNGETRLNQFGETVRKTWLWLFEQYSYLEMDEFVVMPDHFHGIIVILGDMTGAGEVKSLSQIVGAFKTRSSKEIHNLGLSSFQWQRSFYDRIIRNEKELDAIRKYIHENPVAWEVSHGEPEGVLTF